MTKLETLLPRWLILGLALPLIFLNGWLFLQFLQYFWPVVSVFAVATLLAFILDYPVTLLQNRGMSRGHATGLVFLGALVVLILIGLLLLPALVEQLTELAKLLPQWIDSGNQQVQALQNWLTFRRIPVNLTSLVTQFASLLPEEFETLPDEILAFVLGAIDSLLGVILTTVLAFYLLLHGESFWNGIARWLPNELALQVRQALQTNFENYFIGQATIAALEATALTIAFFLLKVPFFLVFGVGIGAMVFIPFGDIVGVTLVSLLVGLQNIWLGLLVLAIAILIDQIIDQGLAPRILGELIGLNPIWIILSLLIGARIGGALGVVVAVPIASSIKSISDHWLQPNPPPISPPQPARLTSEVLPEV
ncbi:AI-2E family transporter [Oculatella sp. LEGE 06141]|uniref:AI-2E family transporter n=1 Tax=Oculatella sp. LEGE 06141 TaxID=1828648 RepID=UPI00188135A9|nr:AI-2E family transporter [Oculatella sp. LEGE 06141]MBE9177612.1 AI-2E family transporter [Oculatella sp. LEGE 06141]